MPAFPPCVRLWLRKQEIRRFMKRKSICDSRSVENISDKRLRIEVQPTSDGALRLGLGLETCLETRFLQSRSRRSQVQWRF